MHRQRLPRKLAAILYADVAGYSRLTGEDEEGTHHRLSQYLDVISASIEQHDGHVVHYAGDAVLADFTTVTDALACATAVQSELASRNQDLPDERKVQFRIGVNLGEVIVDRDDIYGDGVNVAARLESLAEAGGICISESVQTAVGNKLPLGYEFMGEQHVKNIAHPVRVYRVNGGEATGAKAVARKRAEIAPRNIAVALAAIVGIAVTSSSIIWLTPWWSEAPTRPASTPAITLPDRPSVAILPFANMSDDPEQEYFADGMTDDLITDLSKVSGLLVIARNSVFTYKGHTVDLQQVAKELKVRYVLEGSVRRAGHRVRINVQLVDASAAENVWAERYDREYSDIFELQDEVVSKIVSALKVSLTDAEQTQIDRMPTDDLRAYDYYLRAERGVYSLERGEVADALSFYEQAVALDPNFALAYAGYARAAVDVWRRDWMEVLPGPVARTRAYDAASRALKLHPDLPRAFSVLAVLQLVDGRHEEAMESARRALAVDPNNAEAYANLALVLSYAGGPSDALTAIDVAFRLDPKPEAYFYYVRGVVLFAAREYEQAVEPLERARSTREPSDALREVLAATYAQLGRASQAKGEVTAILERVPWANLAYYRILYAYHKRSEDLEHWLEGLRKAGIPEWPFGYEADSDTRLSAGGLGALMGRTWSGHKHGGGPFLLQIEQDGGVAYRDSAYFLTGIASLENDMLCQQFEALLMGRKRCGYVYRNPDATPERGNEYIHVHALGIDFFSVTK